MSILLFLSGVVVGGILGWLLKPDPFAQFIEPRDEKKESRVIYGLTPELKEGMAQFLDATPFAEKYKEAGNITDTLNG